MNIAALLSEADGVGLVRRFARQAVSRTAGRAVDGSGGPEHRLMVAVDIAGFSGRPSHLQVELRRILYGMGREAYAAAGLSWRGSHQEDRGDGFFVLPPPGTGYGAVLGLLPRVADALARHNRVAPVELRFKLRLAVHAGYLHQDAHGIVGADIVHLFRVLDSAGLRRCLAGEGRDLAAAVSGHVHHVAVDYRLVDPDEYRPIDVRTKETVTTAWLWCPEAPSNVVVLRSSAGGGAG